MDYRIKPLFVEERKEMANGVRVTWCGAWLGWVDDYGFFDPYVEPFLDEDGDWIAASDGWEERIIEKLEE